MDKILGKCMYLPRYGLGLRVWSGQCLPDPLTRPF
jgi:hypothetical protein